MRAPLRVVAAIGLSLTAFAANRFDIAHIAKIHRVADPQISPDGRSIVVVVS